MTLLICSKPRYLPDPESAAKTAKERFACRASGEYIDEILSRASGESAAESLYSLLLLSIAVARLAPDLKELPPLLRTDTGKPYFGGSPISFSISHSRGYFACAVSDETELGVDVEATELTEERTKRLSERFFSEREANIAADPESFRRIWTEKEARAKFFGEGMGKIIDLERSGEKEPQRAHECKDIRMHRFEYMGQPVSLCTERDITSVTFTSHNV